MSKHIVYWTDQVKQGTAVVFGPVLDPKGVYGIGVVEIEDEARLRVLLARDPAVKAGLQRDEFYPMSPRSIVRKWRFSSRKNTLDNRGKTKSNQL